MNKKISLGAAIAYMAIVAAVAFCLTMFYSENRYNSMYSNIVEREREYDLLAEIDQYARSSYAGTINEDTLRAGIAAGYISGLDDPYARYLLSLIHIWHRIPGPRAYARPRWTRHSQTASSDGAIPLCC